MASFLAHGVFVDEEDNAILFKAARGAAGRLRIPFGHLGGARQVVPHRRSLPYTRVDAHASSGLLCKAEHVA